MTEPEAAKAVGAARLFIAISHNEILNDDCLPVRSAGKVMNMYEKSNCLQKQQC